MHQCNTKGVFGAGIALKIKHKWPHVAKASEDLCRLVNPLGQAQLVQVNEKLWVANIYGQNNFGGGRRQTDYTAVNKALIDLKSKLCGQQVFLPKNMGCGLAGGSWSLYSSIVNVHFPDATIVEWSCRD